MNRIHTTSALLILMSTALGGCQGIHLANVVALGVTLGVFFGTLQLGRTARPGSTERTREPSATRSAAPRL